jgi:hypothetical protein
MSAAPLRPMLPVYLLRLRPEPGVDHARALRHVLKRLLRDYGMHCVSCEKEEERQ